MKSKTEQIYQQELTSDTKTEGQLVIKECISILVVLILALIREVFLS